jgi:hypothetical protein
LIPGDLGDLGKASLSEKVVTTFLGLVIDDIGNILSLETSTNGSNQRKQKQGLLWRPLEQKQQRHMELCARLMASAHRLYVARVEWAAIDDPNESLMKLLGIPGGGAAWEGDEWSKARECEDGPCPVADLAKSPWGDLVVKNLYQLAAPGIGMLASSSATIKEGRRIEHFSRASTPESLQSFGVPSFELLCHLAALNDSSSLRTTLSPISYLAVIASCAEAFPAGECWISSTQDHWHSLPPLDPLREDVLYCHRCRPDDLAVIIYLISVLLELFGGPGGDIDVQGWILLSLIRLTEASAISLAYTDKLSSLNNLTLAWRRVWKTLLRSDLRYAAYTEGATSTSLGELVLVLLTEIVHRKCVDPTLSDHQSTRSSNAFAYENQAQIWCLPAFGNHRSIHTPSPFELIYSLLEQVGLSEFGSDNIDTSLAAALFNQRISEVRNSGRRRRRLLCLVLARLESHMMQPLPEPRLAEVVVSCIVVLIYGKGNIPSRTFHCGSHNVNPFQFISFVTSENYSRYSGASEDALRQILWSSPSVDRRIDMVENYMAQADVIRATCSRVRSTLLHSKVPVSKLADFVSEAESDSLRNYVLTFLNANIIGGTIQNHLSGESGQSVPSALVDEIDDISDSVSKRPGWQTLTLKIALTVHVSSRADLHRPDLKGVVFEVIQILEKSAATLPFLCSSPKEFLRVATDLLQIIRWMVELMTSGSGLDISLDCLDKTMNECKSLLEGYSRRKKNGILVSDVAPTSQQAEKQGPIRDDLMGSDDDGGGDEPGYVAADPATSDGSDDEGDEAPLRKKRRSLSDFAGKGKNRPGFKDSIAGAPDHLCAKRMGSIILSLDPSLSNCRFVAQALLGQDLDMEPTTVQRDVDIESGIHCADLLNDETVFANRRARREIVDSRYSDEMSSVPEESPIVMVCRALELIRVGASLVSPHYFFGFQSCAQTVRFGESEIRGCSLTEREARIVAEVLKMDTGIVDQPHLRADRVSAATTAFQAGGSTFHLSFDKDFANCFVKTSLTDSSTLVRRQASIAVGIALRCMDESRTIESVSKLLAPITKGKNRVAAKGEFQTWYETIEACLPSDNASEKNVHVEDVFEAFESDALFCRSIIAGSDPRPEGFLEALYYLANIPLTRPDLEGSCFHALEKVASMRKYQTVEHMLEHEAEGILRLWLQQKQSLLELPLLISAPNVLRRLLRAGNIKLLTSQTPAGNSDKQNSLLDIEGLKLEAATSFATKYRRFVVPLSFVKVILKSPSSSETAHIGDPDLQDVATLLIGNDAEAESCVKRMVHCHIHDIQAFGYAMTHSDEATHIRIGHDMLKLVASSVSESVVQSQRKKKAHVVVRRLLELSGKCRVFTSILPSSKQAYFDAIKTFVKDVCSHNDPKRGNLLKNNKGDPFLSLGASYTSFFILASHWLGTAWLHSDRLQRWQTIDLLCDFVIQQIQRNEPDCSQLGFCFHILLEVIVNPSNAPFVHLRALDRLSDILSETLSTLDQLLGAELPLVLKRIICTCFHVHEVGQRLFLSSCRSKWRETRSALQRSLGLRKLATLDNHISGWGWDRNEADINDTSPLNLKAAIAAYGKDVNQDSIKGLFVTFKILQAIVSNATGLTLNSRFFPNSTSDYPSAEDLDALEEADPRFCAQRLVFRFMEKGDHDPDESCAHIVFGVRDRLANQHTFVNKTILADRTGFIVEPENLTDLSSLNVDQRLLYSELSRLERTLRRQPDKVRGLDYIIRELSYVCGASCPDVLRFAASRCLGEVRPDALAEISWLEDSALETVDWLGEAIGKDRLQLTLRAKSLEVLGDCLKSTNTEIAIAATETIEALFSTSEGAEYLKLISDPARKSMLEPFSRTSGVDRGNVLSAPQHHVAYLRSIAGMSSATDCEDWCWNDSFWCSPEPGDRAFDDWICRLLPALILCCYKVPSKKGRGKHCLGNEFFGQCAKICILEPGLCSALFPCIVLDLLEDSINAAGPPVAGQNHSVDPVLNDPSGINLRLSKSFRLLMGHRIDVNNAKSTCSPNSKALALAVDTLGILLRVNQHVFLRSERHQRNPVSLSDRTFTPKISKKTGQPLPTSAEKYLKDLLAPQSWRGVGYGIVLQLDGLLVARSCVLARRFASALFYLDLHLNAQLGDAGGIMEMLSNETGGSHHPRFHSNADISGFALADKFPDGNTSVEINAAALDAMALMAECFEELHEEESSEAVKVQRSSLSFVRNDFVDDVDLDKRAPSLYSLQRLNTRYNSAKGSRPTPLLVAGCMEELGIRRILQTYIEGLASERNLRWGLDESVRQSLREKWFEGSVYSRQWDINLGYQSSGLSEDTNSMHASRSASSGEFALPSLDSQFGSGGGFFESLSGALDSFIRDDMEAFRSLVSQCRRGLLSSASIAATEGSSLVDLVSVVDQLHAIGDLERLASRSISHKALLEEWGLWAVSPNEIRKVFRDGPGDSISGGRPQQKSSSSLSYSMREIILGVLWFKIEGVPDQLSARKGLITHLWDSSSKARLAGSPSEAEATLQRLVRVLKRSDEAVSGTNGLSSDIILRVRLEESKILESRGDFAGAIRKCKQTIDHLKQLDASNTRNCILADALVICGTWMADYKVQQAKIILESYLQPGADKAMMIYRETESVEDAERATSASLALAQLVASLYEALSTRVKSSDWQKMGENIAEQEDDLRNLEPLLKKEKIRLQKMKSANSSEFHTARLELEDRELYLDRRRKEIMRKKDERHNIEQSVGPHLNLAVKSFANALSIADTASSIDLSRHIFRMVSLWFSGDKASRDQQDVNSVMADAIHDIPTFRFVPLTNQLFSRIECISIGQEKNFQHILQRLIFKMCVDHPYHCIVQLIALSNGKNVGSGVGGRNAHDFLKNVGNSKVAAASAILTNLETEGEPFIKGLVASYKHVAEGYIQLANAPTASFHKTQTKDLSFSILRSSLTVFLDKAFRSRGDDLAFPPCVFTKPPPIRPGADYGDGTTDPIGGERIARFKSTFDVSETGLHRPKIVYCTGTNGVTYRQLIKGEDEIRQDAIMSQVFSYVNELMMRRGGQNTHSVNRSMGKRGYSPASRVVKHRLRLICYNIVPLSPASGVSGFISREAILTMHGILSACIVYVVFVRCWNGSRTPYLSANTCAIREGKLVHIPSTIQVRSFLVRLNKSIPQLTVMLSFPSKGEWSHILCGHCMKNSPAIIRRETFDAICLRHSPVFRFFFLERFGASMSDWYSAKQKYTRSVAVNSIVGHILGIGDRHIHNILVHQKTGEVVHIDFGIVFEQGKVSLNRFDFEIRLLALTNIRPFFNANRFCQCQRQSHFALLAI